MKVAIPAEKSSFDSPLDSRFGRAPFFISYDDKNDSWEVINNIQNLNSVQGAGIQAAANVVNSGCGALICSHCGPKAFSALSKAGVTVFSAHNMTVKEAIDSYRNNTLMKMDNADVEGHW